MRRRMAPARLFSLAVVVALLGLVYVGSQLLAQQPVPQVPPSESLKIPVQPPPATPSAMLQSLPAVTGERLKQPADGEWLMVRRTYDGWGYSPLDQIHTRNVARLQPVWTVSTGMNNG